MRNARLKILLLVSECRSSAMPLRQANVLHHSPLPPTQVQRTLHDRNRLVEMTLGRAAHRKQEIMTQENRQLGGRMLPAKQDLASRELKIGRASCRDRVCKYV